MAERFTPCDPDFEAAFRFLTGEDGAPVHLSMNARQDGDERVIAVTIDVRELVDGAAHADWNYSFDLPLRQVRALHKFLGLVLEP